MKEVLFWRNVPILEKLGVEQFNHMIGKGFRKGGILMKQQLFHHFVAGKIQRLLRLIVVDGLINDIGTVGIQKPFEDLILQCIFCCSRIFELFDLSEGTDADPQKDNEHDSHDKTRQNSGGTGNMERRRKTALKEPVR